MRYKLMEWLMSEYNIGHYKANCIAQSIWEKWPQSNHNTDIIKWKGSDINIAIPRKSDNYEKKVICELLPPKKQFTFPFIAPYSKPKKEYIEKIVQIPAYDIFDDYFTEKKVVKIEAFGYRDRDIIIYIDARYDPMEDKLYINLEVKKCGINLP